jgi:preflagellin peptidase FlaK
MGDNVKRKDSLVVAAVLNVGAIAICLVQLIKGAGPSDAAGLRHLQLLAVPLMMLLAYGLYRTQLLSGGADAKAFLSLAVLVPFYPAPLFDPLGIPSIFMVICPFVLAVFFSAAFFTLLHPLGLLFYNLARGDAGRLMFFAYRLPLEEARTKKFIWLSESVEDGKREFHYFRFRDQTGKWKRRQLDILEKAGEKKVWVQPQIPFMVQLAAGFIFTYLLGNIILYGIVRLISGM